MAVVFSIVTQRSSKVEANENTAFDKRIISKQKHKGEKPFGWTGAFKIVAELLRAKRAQRSTMGKKMKLSTHPRKFGNHVTVCSPARPTVRPPAPQTNQCKITQSTGIATEMQLEAVSAGNRIATGVL